VEGPKENLVNKKINKVTEFRKLYDIASYGACFNNKKFPVVSPQYGERSLYDKKQVLKNYMFTLSIENKFNDDDYFTEKLW
jgi:hypothetical protein